MGFRSGIHPDKKYDENIFSDVFSGILGDGVEFGNPSAYQVEPLLNMTVKINPGFIWHEGRFCRIMTDETLTIPIADSIYDRFDIVVVRYDVENKTFYPTLKSGTASGSPSCPDLQRDTVIYEYGVAKIYVKAATTEITVSDITDLRTDPNYCGMSQWKSDGTAINANIQQMSGIFYGWLNGLKDVLDENTAAHLQTEITDLNDSFLSHRLGGF